MTGSGPAGQPTFADVRADLARLLGLVAGTDTDHDATAADVAAALAARPPAEEADSGDGTP